MERTNIGMSHLVNQESLKWNHQKSQFQLNSGDEIAYEHVEEEKIYYIDTTNQRGVLVLPHKPRIGFKLTISDRYGQWLYYPLIIHRNGAPIMGIEEHMTCDEPNSIFVMEYVNPVFGWKIHQNTDKNFNKELLQ